MGTRWNRLCHNLCFEQKQEKYDFFFNYFFFSFLQKKKKKRCMLHGHVFVMRTLSCEALFKYSRRYLNLVLLLSNMYTV